MWIGDSIVVGHGGWDMETGLIHLEDSKTKVREDNTKCSNLGQVQTPALPLPNKGKKAVTSIINKKFTCLPEHQPKELYIEETVPVYPGSISYTSLLLAARNKQKMKLEYHLYLPKKPNDPTAERLDFSVLDWANEQGLMTINAYIDHHKDYTGDLNQRIRYDRLLACVLVHCLSYCIALMQKQSKVIHSPNIKDTKVVTQALVQCPSTSQVDPAKCSGMRLRGISNADLSVEPFGKGFLKTGRVYTSQVYQPNWLTCQVGCFARSGTLTWSLP
ncbi:hypothetical protein DFH28DRAFT_923948 [Melampsora americana]|nr:hypothetical protein DFH28DRAFT_923948 [Melampsora americana]